MKRLQRNHIAFFFGILASLSGGRIVAETPGAATPEAKGTASGRSEVEAKAGSRPSRAAAHKSVAEFSTGRSLSGGQLTSLTDAELIALLQRTIENDEARHRQLTAERDDPRGSYARAQADFEKLDERLRSAEKEAEGEKGDRPKELRKSIEELTPVREASKTRYDLAIERRRTAARLIDLLEARIEDARVRLRIALGDADVVPPGADAPAPPVTPETTAVRPKLKAETPAAKALASTPEGAALSASKAKAKAGAAAAAEKKAPSEELVRAEDDVSRAQALVARIERVIKSIQVRLDLDDRAIALEGSLLENARKLSENAQATRRNAGERLQARSVDGAPADALESIRGELREADRQSTEALDEVRTATERIEELGKGRAVVLEAQMTRRKDLELARNELVEARKRVAQVQNPLAPRNLFRWLLDHGLDIVAILLGTAALYFLVRALGSRIVLAVAERGIRGSTEERVGRANTLVAAFQQASSLAILVGGVLMVLQEVGIPIAPLLGGAAVFGLAVAFGAQNLIRDFFQGFMILIENQYKLNDVIKIGDHSGQVEQITLRTTVLRDSEGNLHFIPNGEIKSVVNMTHGWSRALFNISVAYKEDVDRVMTLIKQMGKEMREEPAFRSIILEEPTMLGVDSLADSAVVIQYHMKTLPLQQWTVKREFLRRIKNRFDAEGIEFPSSQKTVNVRLDDDNPPTEALARAFAGGHNGEHPG